MHDVIVRIASAVLAVIAIAQTAAYLTTAGPPKGDGIGPILAAYHSVEHMLPPHGVIGFIDTAPDADFNTTNYYLAQQALAPRVVSREIGADAAVVITTTGTREVADIPALGAFRLIGTGTGDVLVFRKEQP